MSTAALNKTSYQRITIIFAGKSVLQKALAKTDLLLTYSKSEWATCTVSRHTAKPSRHMYVAQQIPGLTKKEKTALDLLFFTGLNCAAAATRLQITEKEVKTLLRAGIKKLRAGKAS